MTSLLVVVCGLVDLAVGVVFECMVPCTTPLSTKWYTTRILPISNKA